jgi:PAS domain S-box-containing protein
MIEVTAAREMLRQAQHDCFLVLVLSSAVHLGAVCPGPVPVWRMRYCGRATFRYFWARAAAVVLLRAGAASDNHIRRCVFSAPFERLFLFALPAFMPDSTSPIDYRALFHLLPDNYLLLAADGTVLDNSDAHVEVSLLPRERAVGRNIFTAYPSDPQSQADLNASHDEVRRTLQPHTMPLLRYDLERPAEMGGGIEEKYWQITHFPLLNERGELQYILQRPQDVTEATLAAQRSEQAQRDLDEANERSRFILESVPVMVWTTDGDGSTDFFNQRWLNYTGRSLAQTVGAGWADDLHPDDVARTHSIWQQACRNRTPYQAEYRIRRHDGQYRWHLAQGTPRLNANGEVQMWVGCNTDIEAQKQLVAELLEASEQQALLVDQAHRSLQQSQHQRQILWDLFMDAPAMISIVRGPEHRYEYANRQFMDLVGHQEVVGRTVAEVFPEIVSRGILTMLDNVFSTGEPVIGKELFVPIATSDGSGQLRDAYFSFVYQRFEEDGEPAGVTAYSYEVTELVQARQALLARDAGESPAGS